MPVGKVDNPVHRGPESARAWLQAAALIGVLAIAVIVLRFVADGESPPQLSAAVFTSTAMYLILASDARVLLGRFFRGLARVAVVHSAFNLALVAYFAGRG